MPRKKAEAVTVPQTKRAPAWRDLELVHNDLYGPIEPEMPSGSKNFLLLVDDQSWYMWVDILPSKDRATVAIKDIKAQAEGE